MQGESLDERYKKQSLSRLETHVFPEIGDLPITEITIPEVVAVVELIIARRMNLPTIVGSGSVRSVAE